MHEELYVGGINARSDADTSRNEAGVYSSYVERALCGDYTRYVPIGRRPLRIGRF